MTQGVAVKVCNINKENEERAIKWMERACATVRIDLPEITRSDPNLVMFKWRQPGHVVHESVAEIHMNRIGAWMGIRSPKTVCSFWITTVPYSSSGLQGAITDLVKGHVEDLKRTT